MQTDLIVETNRVARRQITIVRVLVCFVIFGLLVSGLTAIPLVAEIDALVSLTDAGSEAATGPGPWLITVRDALHATKTEHPLLFYGTDWLAFGHVVIAVTFIGAWLDPVRNRWLFDFGLIACAMVIPWALLFGELRGIPVWWRFIDCSFGVVAAIPLWWCRRTIGELERASA